MHKIIAVSFSSPWEADTVQKVLESSVGPQRIKGRPQQNGRVESRLIALVQPDHCLVLIAETYIDEGDVGFGGRVLVTMGLQILGYFQGFFLLSQNGVDVGETGVEYPTVSGNIDRFLKFCYGFIVHVFLLERLP